eukprot:Gregarina_sp_Poly_1__247@NODE_1058_length_5210_cov_99_576123_g736_i0_p3_GENE_NODE_1058_length_5210_cov_99_576123_g736_i0NODE_1058_length_5210_cov_99_576123_g736_i0_p3_ORF_typecomplete_len154_score26_29SP2/PF03014_14/0_65_NODE_1058_length_5210_cov_99_576123_g736_i029353396
MRTQSSLLQQANGVPTTNIEPPRQRGPSVSCGDLRATASRPRQSTDPVPSTPPPALDIRRGSIQMVSPDRIIVPDESSVPPGSSITGYYYEAYETSNEGPSRLIASWRADEKIPVLEQEDADVMRTTTLEDDGERIRAWDFHVIPRTHWYSRE